MDVARCCGRSVVGGGRLSDATTWTIDQGLSYFALNASSDE